MKLGSLLKVIYCLIDALDDCENAGVSLSFVVDGAREYIGENGETEYSHFQKLRRVKSIRAEHIEAHEGLFGHGEEVVLRIQV